MATPLRLVPGSLPLQQIRQFVRAEAPISLDPSCRAKVDRSAQMLSEVIQGGDTVYGINTGFGRLATTRISSDDLAKLQTNLILSHAVGTGPLLDDSIVRLILALKVASLARGHSGVRWSLIEALLSLLQHEVYPCIPMKGSVGASGDLAPLAHMSAALLGVGSVRHKGEVIPARAGLKLAGLSPFALAPKEGLALVNGTQVSAALSLVGLFAAEDLLAAAVVAGALSVDAAKASDVPFDPRIQALRGQPGQTGVAVAVADLLAGSEIRQSHLDCGRVQDPYCLRCMPQILGACLDQFNFVAEILVREANAVTDNPLVFPDDGDVLSGGNFHGQPIAQAADLLAIALTEVGSLLERQIAMLVDATISELPAFLVEDGGVNSGFMVAHVAAASLASENKVLAHPASVDTIPTSANQEDHVSMSTFAAARLLQINDNVAGIAAIALLAAVQGVEFHMPLRTSEPLQTAMAEIRERVPRYAQDRFFAPDIEVAKTHIVSGAFYQHCRQLMPSAA